MGLLGFDGHIMWLEMYFAFQWFNWGISSLHVDSYEDSTTPKATNFGHEISSMDICSQIRVWIFRMINPSTLGDPTAKIMVH